MALALPRLGFASPAGATLDLDFRRRRASIAAASGALARTPLDAAGLTMGRATNGYSPGPTGILRQATSNTLRFVNHPRTGAPLGYLSEQAVFNQFLQSGDLSTAAWGRNGVNPVLNARSNVFGQRAAALILDTTGSPGSLQQNWLSMPTSGGYCISVYAAPYDGRVLTVTGFLTGSGAPYRYCTFDLLTGTVLSKSGTDLVPFCLPGPAGYWLCGHYAYNTSGSNGIGVMFERNASGTGLSAGTGIYLDAPMLTMLPQPTSYIPTGAAAGLRDADSLTLPIGAWFTAGSGTIIWEGTLDGTAGEIQTLLRITGPNPITVQKRFHSTLGTYITADDGKGHECQLFGVAPFSAVRLAFSYGGAGMIGVKSGGGRNYLGGDAVTAAFTLPGGAANLEIAHAGGSQQLNGVTGRLAYSPLTLDAAGLTRLVA